MAGDRLASEGSAGSMMKLEVRCMLNQYGNRCRA